MKSLKLNKKQIIKSISILIFNLLLFLLIIYKDKLLKKVGVVGVRHETNIGNNLIKYAMTIKLKELGYIPYIIGTVWKRFNNIEFINQNTNLVIIKNNFSELKKNDYDILIVIKLGLNLMNFFMIMAFLNLQNFGI